MEKQSLSKKSIKFILIGVLLLCIGCVCGMLTMYIVFDGNENKQADSTINDEKQEISINYSELTTYTPYPTYTIYPTYTPQPLIVVTATFSPTPRYTSTSTYTPTITNTPTITPTPTRTSTPTATPNQTKTQQAVLNATKGYASTATTDAKNAYSTKVASYYEIPSKELTTYPDKHDGEKVKVRGRVFNVNSDTEFQMWIGWTYDSVYIVMENPYDDIYEDEWVTVYGTVLGEHCGTNVYGGQVCSPLVLGDFYEKK